MKMKDRVYEFKKKEESRAKESGLTRAKQKTKERSRTFSGLEEIIMMTSSVQSRLMSGFNGPLTSQLCRTTEIPRQNFTK
jgi:hypothetical protein